MSACQRSAPAFTAPGYRKERIPCSLFVSKLLVRTHSRGFQRLGYISVLSVKICEIGKKKPGQVHAGQSKPARAPRSTTPPQHTQTNLMSNLTSAISSWRILCPAAIIFSASALISTTASSAVWCGSTAKYSGWKSARKYAISKMRENSHTWRETSLRERVRAKHGRGRRGCQTECTATTRGRTGRCTVPGIEPLERTE